MSIEQLEHTRQTGEGAGGGHRPRIVVVGSGFGGLFGAQALRHADAEVTLVARTSHHLFQPLLYQVATGILSVGEVAPSTREVLSRQRNVEVVLGNVTQVDLAERTVTARVLDREGVYPYDYLLLAAGSGQSWFGHDEFAAHAPGMKSIDDALELRGRIFGCFEMAELAADRGRPEDVDRLMTFVVVGAGPTGVEMAGQIAELSGRTLKHDFRRIDPTRAHVILVDALDKVLSNFGERLGSIARHRLERMGVDIRLGAKVVDVDATGIVVENQDGSRNRIEAVCKVWAAGVEASPLGRQVAGQCGAKVDGAGRVKVNPDLTLPGHPEVFVVGDMATLPGLPGLAQGAIQTARYSARQIIRRIAGSPPQGPFTYFDKGNMATVSRFSAVASIGKARFGGFPAWVLWLGVHLVYIIGFKSRLTTLLHWAVSFLGRGRAERTVTEQQIFARLALEQLGDRFTPSFERTHPGDQQGEPEPPIR